MIAPGTVKARASTMRFTNSSEKGTPGVEVVFNILEGPDKGTNVVWRGWMTEKTRVRTAESLEACGFDGENDATVTKNEVYIVIEHEEYEGKTRPRVAWVNDMSRGPGSTPMDSGEGGRRQGRYPWTHPGEESGGVWYGSGCERGGERQHGSEVLGGLRSSRRA